MTNRITLHMIFKTDIKKFSLEFEPLEWGWKEIQRFVFKKMQK